MPYQFIEEFSGGDICFEVTGKTREELIISAAEATMNAMVENLENIQDQQSVFIRCEHRNFDLLLFKFLNEIIFIKDTQRLLFRMEEVHMIQTECFWKLDAIGKGEPVDCRKHALRDDVKAVTMYRFQVRQSWAELEGNRCFRCLMRRFNGFS